MKNRNNIRKLIACIRDLESQDLEDILRLQHGSYTFDRDVLPVLAVRRPGENPRLFVVREAAIVEPDPGPDDYPYVEVKGSFTDEDIPVESCIRDAEGAFFPGELSILARQIPTEWLDPAILKEGYALFQGTREVEESPGVMGEITVNPALRTVMAKCGDDSARFVGRAADEIIYKAMKRFDRTGDFKKALESLYRSTDIDLPF